MPLARARTPRPSPDEVPGAAPFLPARRSLPQLRAAVHTCRGCTLYREATQAVFGEGSAASRVMLIGEVPGDREDLAGTPFVGPSGQLLDEALAAAGIPRDEVYVTNAVKHFKFATVHPSSVLRAPDVETRSAAREDFCHDLALVGDYFRRL